MEKKEKCHINDELKSQSLGYLIIKKQPVLSEVPF